MDRILVAASRAIPMNNKENEIYDEICLFSKRLMTMRIAGDDSPGRG
jgi:hypothetical protein